MPLKNQKLLNAEQLIERWSISELDLLKMLVEGKLKHYRVDDLIQERQETTRIKVKGHSQLIKLEHLPQLAFALEDVKKYEKEDPELKTTPEPKPLDGKERQELGDLRTQKEKWDKSIEAAVQATLFCAKENSGNITRKQIWEELTKNKLHDIHHTTFNKIWKAIPQEYRSGGGRPKKKK